MLSVVVGSKGFLGSALLRYANKYLENEEWIGINRENRTTWANTRQWNTVIWAAGMSSKRLCEQDSTECFEKNIQELVQTFNEFPCDKFIYISSAAVYPEGWKHAIEEFEIYQEDDDEIDINNLSTYGAMKYLGELLVQRRYNNYLILRPNGFTGPGLKKNAVFDLLANNPPQLYNTWESRFQYMHVDQFANILFILASSCNREVFNVTSPDVVTLIDVANIHDIDIKAVRTPSKKLERVRAVIDTSKLEAFLRNTDHYIPSSKEAIKNWNVAVDLSMYQVRERVG